LSFDAGSVIGHFTLDSSGYVSGANKIGSANSGITGSMIKANLVTDALKKTIGKSIDAIKSIGVSAFNSAVKMENYITSFTTLTGSAKTANAVISEFKAKAAATPFSMNDFAEGGKLLLSFGQTAKSLMPTMSMLGDIAMGNKEKFGQLNLVYAQIMSTGKLLGGDLLQLINAGFNPLTIMAQKTGKSVAQLKDEMSKGAISAAMVTDAFKTATSEGGLFFNGMQSASKTFSGQWSTLLDDVESLERVFGDFVLPIAKEFVSQMDSAVKSVTAFVQSSAGIEQIGNVLKPLAGVLFTVWEVAGNLFDTFKSFLGGVFASLQEGFTTVAGKGNEASTAFNLLGGVLKIISAGFMIIGKIINTVIQEIADLINAVRKSVDILGAFGEALTDPLNSKKWQAVADKGKIALDAFAKFGTDLVNNYSDIVKTTLNELNNFTTGAKDNSDKLATSFANGVEMMNKALSKYQSELAGAGTGTNDLIDTTNTATNKIVDTWKDLAEKAGEAISTSGLFSPEAAAAIDNFTDYAFEQANKVLDAFSSAFNQISDIVSMSYDNQLTEIDNDYKRKKAAIENNVKDEEQKAEQLEALEKDHAKKVSKVKKQQFEANKTAAVIGAIIATAQSVMTTFSQFGWPWGIIPAAIMAGIGAAQVGMIASQPTPEFAMGGVAQPGVIKVGERGPELIAIGQTSRIEPAEVSQSLIGETIKRSNNEMVHTTIQIDGRTILQVVTQGLRDGVDTIPERSIVAT
jgi:tape measure domain-containing protein